MISTKYKKYVGHPKKLQKYMKVFEVVFHIPGYNLPI